MTSAWEGCLEEAAARSLEVGLQAFLWPGWNEISLVSLLPTAYLVQAVRAAGKCDAVFKGFSDCLLKLGDSMANYPQGLDDKTNIKTVCT